MTGYNPISYHNGSVWPHDNALCAAGLMRYGFVDEAHRVMEGIVHAAAYFGNRLPELFAGLARRELPFPGELPHVVLTAGVGGGVAAVVPPVDAALRSRRARTRGSISRPACPSGWASSCSSACR